MGSSYNLNIEWKNGEITPEPLDIFAADDPVVRAIYAKQNKLLDTPDWQRFERKTNKHRKLLRMANQAKLRSFRTTPKFMYENEISEELCGCPSFRPTTRKYEMAERNRLWTKSRTIIY